MNADARRSRPETWLAAVWSLLMRITIAAVVVYALYRVQFIIVVVLVAVMLALSLAPVVDWLQRSRLFRPLPRRVRRSLATTLVFIAVGFLFVELTVTIVRPLATEVRIFAANWESYRQDLTRWFQTLQEQYAGLPPDLRAWLEQQGVGDLGPRVGEQLQHIVQRTLESGMLLVELILIPVLAFSFLTESRPLKRELAMVVPAHRLREALFLVRRIGHILQSYAIGQLILALIAGGVTWALLMALGIRYAVAMAVLAAITRVIPVIGPVLGGIPIVLLSALQSWQHGLIVLVSFSLMHFIESKVIMPRVIGHRIHLHPAVVIIVLLVGAEFFGMGGMFLAAPVAAVGKVLFHHFLVRPRVRARRRHGAVLGPPAAAVPEPAPGVVPAAVPSAVSPPVSSKEVEVERPAVAGIGGHSGAH